MDYPSATIKIEVIAHPGDATAVDLALMQYRSGRWGGVKPEIGDQLCRLVEEFLQQHGVEAQAVVG